MSKDDKLLQQYLAELERRERDMCFDPYRPGSRPTDKQQEILDAIENTLCRYVVAANQVGKTQMGAREAAWLLQGNHPTFDAKAAWGDRPLTMLVIGKSTKMMMNELWEAKVKPLLAEGSFKEHIQGGVLQWVTHKETGNKLIFISHNNPNEAREHAQGYVAQWVWLDEMPDSIELFGELVTRVISSRGRFIATFTPLIRNIQIKDMIEGAQAPYSSKFKLKMLDNPIFFGREEELLSQYAGYSEAERNARLYGDWFLGSSAVYTVESAMIEAPECYHPSWRHVEAIDPAARGKSVFIMLTERPETNDWYVVKAEYIDEDTAGKILRASNLLTRGYNIAVKVSDPHETWFINEAREQGFKYKGVFNKQNRKKELINNSQELLYSGRLKIAPWCTGLIDELASMQWSESNTEKIVASSKYHITDSFQYACDNLPKPIKTSESMPHQVRLKHEHRERIRREAIMAENKLSGGPRVKLKARKGRIIRRG